MTDYTTEAHNIFLSATFLPTAKLSFTGRFDLNKSKAEMDEVDFPDVRAMLGVDTLPHQDFTFEEIHEYSNLDYQIIRAGLGLEYKLMPRVTFTADGEWADLDDKTGYVYGIESGSYFLIRSGFRFEF
jgi:hypothetical protein